MTILEAKVDQLIRTVATKEDLKSFATKEDLLKLEKKMDNGFSAVRKDIEDLAASTAREFTEFRGEFTELRNEVESGFREVHGDIANLGELSYKKIEETTPPTKTVQI